MSDTLSAQRPGASQARAQAQTRPRPRPARPKVDIPSWVTRHDPARAWLRGESYDRARRLIDVVLTIAAMPIALPLICVCAVLLKIERPKAPIFFRQFRTGADGVRFRIFKLRTMVPDAEHLRERVAELNVLAWPDFKAERDPRITRLGKILRRTALDELPQLFNVLRGEMTLVGPRPTSFGPETYEPWQRARLRAPQGLTGLWQVTGRGQMEFAERVVLDLGYLRHRCVALDLEILVRTVSALLCYRGPS